VCVCVKNPEVSTAYQSVQGERRALSNTLSKSTLNPYGTLRETQHLHTTSHSPWPASPIVSVTLPTKNDYQPINQVYAARGFSSSGKLTDFPSLGSRSRVSIETCKANAPLPSLCRASCANQSCGTLVLKQGFWCHCGAVHVFSMRSSCCSLVFCGGPVHSDGR
jgi:hypothetical protein